jgi:beta-glucosidase
MNFLYSKEILCIILIIVTISCFCDTAESQKMALRDSKSKKIDSLLSIMTLKEKVGQLNQYSVGSELTGPGKKNSKDQIRHEQLKNGEVGSVLNLLGAKDTYEMQKFVVENSRLSIPLIFSFDVVHGYKTIFPIPLGESASWDLEAVEKSAQIAAREAASAGIQWTFAPMVDISQDARWGRVMEGAGEDPYLGSLIAKARIKGFQGENLNSEYTLAACAKHFAGYGFVESGKDYNTVNIGKHQLLNTILPPFKASVEAGAATFMNAFNDIDGIPSTGNEYLLRNVLKGDWKFDGVVVSDWNSIGEMINHGVVSDTREAAKLAITAGSDIDMEGNAYVNHLVDLVNKGEINEERINEAVRRVLLLKLKLGLFDDPYKYFDEERESKNLLNEQHLQVAEDVARKSIVLLKNEGALLPLKSKKIAIIGPLAKDKDSPLGNWRGAATPNSAISLYEGLVNRLGHEIEYAEGCKLSIGPNNFFEEVVVEKSDRSGFAKAIALAKKSDVVIMALGETAYMSGEGRSRADIGLPGLQLELLQEVYKVNKNVVLVLMNGRPLSIPWEDEHIPAIVETWHLGSMAGNAIADVLIGNYNPSGKLPMSFPRFVGQLPIYYNHKNTGRPSASPGQVFYTHHTDIQNDPLYPFGFGLSYSNFEYGAIQLSTDILQPDESIVAKISVSNKSEIDGEEVVQLYIQDVVGSITRSIKELKAFQKVFIKAGGVNEIVFKISSEDLKYYRKDLTYGIEPGTFNLFIGSNSRDLQSVKFELK